MSDNELAELLGKLDQEAIFTDALEYARDRLPPDGKITMGHVLHCFIEPGISKQVKFKLGFTLYAWMTREDAASFGLDEDSFTKMKEKILSDMADE